MTSVYKYRGLAALRRDLKSLVADCFYAPTAKLLNDPTEAVLNEKLSHAHIGVPGQVADAFQTLIGMRHTVGIYSLSRTVTDELMWAHYADSHQGYCIEYDLERLVLDARSQWDVLEVSYSDEPPSLPLFEALVGYDGKTIARPLVGYKSRRWEYERELRIITARSGVNYYARSAVTGVYFGCRCSEETRTRIRRCLRGRPVRYAVMEFPANSYQLLAAPLPRLALDGPLSSYMAPIQDGAVPSRSELGEYEAKHPKLLKAVERVQRDPACRSIVYANVSTREDHRGQIVVQYETRVKTDLHDAVNWYFTDEELE